MWKTPFLARMLLVVYSKVHILKISSKNRISAGSQARSDTSLDTSKTNQTRELEIARGLECMHGSGTVHGNVEIVRLGSALA